MSKLTELREARQKAHADLSAVLALTPSADNNETARKLIAESDRLKTEIDKLETRGLSTVGEGIKAEKNVELRRAFQTYLRMGERAPREVKEQLESRDGIIEGNTGNHIGTYSDMGYFVPTGFVNDVEVATKYFCDMIGACGSLDTASGNPLPYPTSNDTTNVAALLGESSPASELDVTASQIKFNAYKYTSGLIKASIELVQDSAFNIEAFVAKQMGTRFGRKWEDVLINGSGGGTQPTGLLTAIAASGATPVVAAGSNPNDGITGNTGVNSIGYQDLVNLEHSVDRSYRRGASYVMHDSTVASLQKVLDKFGRPLFVPGINGEPDRVNNYPIVVNNAMPQIGASNVTVAFGPLDKYLVRRVKDFQILVLRERYAEAGQVGFVGFARLDANLLDAGTHPFGTLQQHS
jgi:HK97 family phage major capsid protein